MHCQVIVSLGILVFASKQKPRTMSAPFAGDSWDETACIIVKIFAESVFDQMRTEKWQNAPRCRFVLLVHIFVFVVVVTRRLELHRESFTVSCRPWCTYPEANFSVPTITDTCGCTNRLLFLDNGIRHYSALDKLNIYNRNVFFYNSARASRETTMVDLRHRA